MSIELQSAMLDAIERELQKQVSRLDQPQTKQFHEMLTYHMGWTGERAGPQATGKRIRPLLMLFVLDSVSESKVKGISKVSWLHAISVAASIELIHNFSLVHDDIQDNSELRRGRKTVWVKWGQPMAINVGDALFVIANQAALDLQKHYPPGIVLRASGILNDCCLQLTQGQYLDMSYEERTDLTIDDYWPMVGGKTSALLSSCTQTGAILGYAQEERVDSYRLFGYHLGLAFQIQDDILGIWGDEMLTGKSAASDLVEGKNSLPVLYGLEHNGEFANRWRKGPISPDEVAQIASVLEKEGGRAFAEKMSEEETHKALSFLEQAAPLGEAGKAILELTNMLLKRNQ